MQILIMKHICFGYDSKKHFNISELFAEVEPNIPGNLSSFHAVLV